MADIYILRLTLKDGQELYWKVSNDKRREEARHRLLHDVMLKHGTVVEIKESSVTPEEWAAIEVLAK